MHTAGRDNFVGERLQTTIADFFNTCGALPSAFMHAVATLKYFTVSFQQGKAIKKMNFIDVKSPKSKPLESATNSGVARGSRFASLRHFRKTNRQQFSKMHYLVLTKTKSGVSLCFCPARGHTTKILSIVFDPA